MPMPFSTAMPDRHDAVDRQHGRARLARLAPGRAEPVHVLEVGRSVLAEDDDAVIVDVVGRVRLAEALQVGGRGVDVEVDGEELALHEVGLRRARAAGSPRPPGAWRRRARSSSRMSSRWMPG